MRKALASIINPLAVALAYAPVRNWVAELVFRLADWLNASGAAPAARPAPPSPTIWN